MNEATMFFLSYFLLRWWHTFFFRTSSLSLRHREIRSQNWATSRVILVSFLLTYTLSELCTHSCNKMHWVVGEEVVQVVLVVVVVVVEVLLRGCANAASVCVCVRTLRGTSSSSSLPSSTLRGRLHTDRHLHEQTHKHAKNKFSCVRCAILSSAGRLSARGLQKLAFKTDVATKSWLNIYI